VDILQQQLGKTIDQMTANDIIQLTDRWKEAIVELDKTLHKDAGKEFAATAQIGYGLDGNEETKQADFGQVRGTFEENSLVLEIEKHIAAKTELGDKVINRMKELP
jgi:hypothetical protein